APRAGGDSIGPTPVDLLRTVGSNRPQHCISEGMDMGQRRLTAADGHTFGAYEARPSAAAKGAVVVIQEIFGVNRHIRRVVDDYAKAGYAAIAPQIFDRVEANVEL